MITVRRHMHKADLNIITKRPTHPLRSSSSHHIKSSDLCCLIAVSVYAFPHLLALICLYLCAISVSRLHITMLSVAGSLLHDHNAGLPGLHALLQLLVLFQSFLFLPPIRAAHQLDGPAASEHGQDGNHEHQGSSTGSPAPTNTSPPSCRGTPSLQIRIRQLSPCHSPKRTAGPTEQRHCPRCSPTAAHSA